MYVLNQDTGMNVLDPHVSTVDFREKGHNFMQHEFAAI